MTEKECYEKMKKCPRFITCSCPICPLDFNWLQRVFIKGEGKCKLPKKDLKKLGFNPQVKARTEVGKTHYKNWLKQQGKAEKNLKKYTKSHVFTKGILKKG